MNRTLKKQFRDFFDKIRRGRPLPFKPFPHQMELLSKPWVMDALPWFSALSTGQVLYPWEYSITALELHKFRDKINPKDMQEMVGNWRWIVNQLRAGEMSVSDLRILGIPTGSYEPDRPNAWVDERQIQGLVSGSSSLHKIPAMRPEQKKFERHLVSDGWRAPVSKEVFRVHLADKGVLIQFPYGIWRLPDEFWFGTEGVTISGDVPVDNIRATAYHIWCLMTIFLSNDYEIRGGRISERPLSYLLPDSVTVTNIAERFQASPAIRKRWGGLPLISDMSSLQHDAVLAQKVINAFEGFMLESSPTDLVTLLYTLQGKRFKELFGHYAPELCSYRDPRWYENGELRLFKDVSYYRAFV